MLFYFNKLLNIPQKEEFESLRYKNSTSKRGGTRYMPYAFTEHGVAQLSSVLNSDIAIEINIQIIRAFIAIRQMVTLPPIDRVENQMQELKDYIEEVFTDYNDINEETRMQLELINQTLAELQTQKKLSDKPRNPIGFVKSKDYPYLCR